MPGSPQALALLMIIGFVMLAKVKEEQATVVGVATD